MKTLLQQEPWGQKQRTHNPLVVGSNPTGPIVLKLYNSGLLIRAATTRRGLAPDLFPSHCLGLFATGTKGRYNIGATENLPARLERLNTVMHSTKRLGLPSNARRQQGVFIHV